MRKPALLFALAIFCLAACNNDRTERCAFRPDTDDIKIDLQWESLEDSLPSVTNEQQLKRFLNKHPDVRELFFGRSEYPSDSLFTKSLMDRFTSPYMDTLVTDTHRVFGDGSKLKEEFTKAFANFKYYYPDFQPPKIKTMISGLEADVYVSDTLVIIGLDYFIGPTRKYQIQNIPYEYITRRYQPGYVVPSVMLLFGIDSKYNKVNQQDRTMVADMISYGKAYYFAKQMSPCTPDSVLIGYTSREINGSRANESLIWSRLVEDQVLFSTSGVDRQNYINERPKTLEVGPECPGRIGRWIGWRIVETYHEDHPDQSLKQIMENSDAQKMFKESGYKPSLTKVPSRQKNL